jgi:hypothetical protein
VTSDRCPGCQAAVTPGAPWCTLCYADLRVPATAPAIAEYAPSMAAIAQSTPAQTAPDPILDGPIAQAAPIARRELTGWPCGCGALVPMADNACSHCGRTFLPTDDMPSVSLPGVGDLSKMDRTQKIVVTIVAGLVATALLVGVLFVAGSIL